MTIPLRHLGLTTMIRNLGYRVTAGNSRRWKLTERMGVAVGTRRDVA